MIFGYEMSFLGPTLKRIHKKAGFKKVKVGKFNVKLTFDFVPFKFLKNIMRNIKIRRAKNDSDLNLKLTILLLHPDM